MQQRAMIALALACKPKILLADEPTTALDATVQIQILLLLRELQREFGMSVIFVTHDIGVAIEICDRVAAMYAPARSSSQEHASPDRAAFAGAPSYARGLLASTSSTAKRGQRLETIPGTPPLAFDHAPVNCSFAPRAAALHNRCCTERLPPNVQIAPDRMARCILAELCPGCRGDLEAYPPRPGSAHCSIWEAPTICLG